ncbi:MAG: hypothetical protein P9X24_05925 [Candidatus Hatepunaea meridiana]|nr:hypothetical protein [Candidatus Hatepunaea meridiana]
MSEQSLLINPPQFIINEKGERVSAILDIETFRRIMEQLEDIYDNYLMDEVENEPGIPWEEVKESLKREGKI